MTDTANEPISTHNLDRYGSAELPWGRPLDILVTDTNTVDLTDSATLERLAGVYRSGGWPASVEDDALTAPYSAPSAGPPPWHLYRLAPHTAFGVATAEPHGATRWNFAR